MSALPRIPVSQPDIRGDEVNEVMRAIEAGWISSAGPQLTEFERVWAAYCGRSHGIAVSSGTTALELAVEVLGLSPGDEVIMPSFTIISCALAVVRAGAVPVVVDSDARTWCMDVREVERSITARTRAIMVVHIYGHPCDMEALEALAAKHALVIIEDAAEAHGAECLVTGGWRRCGSFGALSAFSFYANKLVTTGEGGMVVTNDDMLAERLRSQRNLAFGGPRRFHHKELGHQYRLTNIQAALGLPQVARLGETMEMKRRVARSYRERLTAIDALELQVEEPWARSVWWMLGIVLRDHHPLDARELAERLEKDGIETRPFFLGMHEQPALRDIGLFAGLRLPVAERLARRGLYLPSSTTLTDDEIDRVCATVARALA